MASAPPLESSVPVGYPPPPSYEETMRQPYPQYPQPSLPPVPGYDKAAHSPHPQQLCGPPMHPPPACSQPAFDCGVREPAGADALSCVCAVCGDPLGAQFRHPGLAHLCWPLHFWMYLWLLLDSVLYGWAEGCDTFLSQL
ncbi:hypothetical protein JZ751_026203 [Albula glossodonta]|uniref:Uncharacterized protein n=1 Tax=Albula glossodonta TaxID=121402 RepID=A0A8T2PCU3_9TELE|nr:hypothetical protein JZ751_026203 [Albula glossodonta]